MNRFRFDMLRPHVLPLVLLLSATLVVYVQMLGHDFINNWDDSVYVTENPAVQGFSYAHLRTIFSTYYTGNYAPVQMLSYMFDYSVWGLWAGGYLLNNLLIHSVNGLLVYHLMIRCHGERVWATFGAAVFLLHPVQVESVAWVSQRKTLLAMMFVLLAWEAYSCYRESNGARRRWAYAASLAAFSLALLSKSVAVILPVVLVLFGLCFYREKVSIRLKDKLPFVLAAGTIAVLAFISQQSAHGGGRAGFHGGSPLATFLTMLPVFIRYLRLTVWPVGLSVEYDPAIHQSLDAAVLGSLIVLALIVVASVWLYRFDRRPAFWLMYFFVALAPVSQIVPLVTLMNDRYLYFPLLGASALAGALASRLLKVGGRLQVKLAGCTLVSVLILLAVLSFERVKVWKSDLALWSDAVSKSPARSSTWSALGDVYVKLGQYDQARQVYEHALQLNPGEKIALLNLGALYSRSGELERGYELLRIVKDIEPENYMVWANLGNNQMLRGDYEEARKSFRQALELRPDDLKVTGLLGDASLALGQTDAARNYYNQVESRGGAGPETAFQLACVEAKANHTSDSLAWLEKAFQRGWNDYDTLLANKELEPLRGIPEFENLVRRYFPALEQDSR